MTPILDQLLAIRAAEARDVLALLDTAQDLRDAHALLRARLTGLQAAEATLRTIRDAAIPAEPAPPTRHREPVRPDVVAVQPPDPADLAAEADAVRFRLRQVHDSIFAAPDAPLPTWAPEPPAPALDRGIAEPEQQATPPPAAAHAPPPPPPAAAPPPAPEAAPPAAPETKPRTKMTAERLALAKELWPQVQALTADQVLRRLNALPGEPIASVGALQMALYKRGIPKSRLAYADQLAAANAAPPANGPEPEPAEPPRAPRPAFEVPPTRPRPPQAPPPETTPDPRLSQARSMLREGYADGIIRRRSGLTPEQMAALLAEAEQTARAMIAAGRHDTDAISAASHLPPASVRQLRRDMAAGAAA